MKRYDIILRRVGGNEQRRNRIETAENEERAVRQARRELSAEDECCWALDAINCLGPAWEAQDVAVVTTEDAPAEPPAPLPEDVEQEPTETPLPVAEAATDSPELDAGEISVEELGLSAEVVGMLVGAGIETMGQVEDHPDLTAINGIGKVTAKLILAACETYRDEWGQ